MPEIVRFHLVKLVNVSLSPPNAPVISDITPDPGTGIKINLAWSNCSGASTYYVYRDTSPIDSVDFLVPIMTTEETVAQDTIRTNGTYYYVVVAGNQYGNSSVSNCIHVEISPPPLVAILDASGADIPDYFYGKWSNYPIDIYNELTSDGFNAIIVHNSEIGAGILNNVSVLILHALCPTKRHRQL